MSSAQSQAAMALNRATTAEAQAKAQEVLREEAEAYPYRLLTSYMNNPFLRFETEDVDAVRGIANPQILGDLVALRNAATSTQAPRHAVFCMPKSGSSFIQSALKSSLQLPLVSLTSFTNPGASSGFGMNGREQELDELAVIKAVLQNPGGFVAQHHTRFTPFLGLQLQLYGVRPVVTFRNIFDCIVSYDDMMLQWRADAVGDKWASDPQFPLPLDYEAQPAEVRYTLLAHTLGTWLVNFYVSWSRGIRAGLVDPLVVRYEDDVLDPERLVDLMSRRLEMNLPQRTRLAAIVERPDRDDARLNVGRKGRGEELLPERIKIFLADYVGMFRGELSAGEIRYLVR